jgi:hypothetical protein
MNAEFFSSLWMMAASVPYLAIVLLLIHYCVRRARFRRQNRQRRKLTGFCPSSAALGLAFLFLSAFSRPSIAHVIEARLKQDVEEDDQGDPDSPVKYLHRQLRRIRRGERIDQLVLRL